jgi:hypothetical protein
MSTMFSIGFVGVSSQTIRVDLLCRDELERVALRLVNLGEHAVDAAVHIVHGHYPLARVDEVHQRRSGADPRRVSDAELRTLERREHRLQRGPGWIPAARVVVALVDADRLLDVRRRLIDRRRERASRRIWLLPLVDCAGLEVHLSAILVWAWGSTV